MTLIVVATCTGTGQEAIYKDGVLAFADTTVYACDIAAEAGSSEITLAHWVVEDVEEWPKSLGELEKAE